MFFLVLPLVLGAAAISGERDRQRSSGTTAQPKQQAPAQQVQPTQQSIQSDDGLNVQVDQCHQQNLDAAFDVIEQCGEWQRFESMASGVIQDDNHPEFSNPNINAFVRLARNKLNGVVTRVSDKLDITVRSSSLQYHPNDLAFVLLHEMNHIHLYLKGQNTLDNAEEVKCDAFAANTLTKHGFKFSLTPRT